MFAFARYANFCPDSELPFPGYETAIKHKFCSSLKGRNFSLVAVKDDKLTRYWVKYTPYHQVKLEKNRMIAIVCCINTY